MENLIKSFYIEPAKIIEKEIRDVERCKFGTPCHESDITKDEFQPKEKFVIVRETPQVIPETQEKDETSKKPNSK